MTRARIDSTTSPENHTSTPAHQQPSTPAPQSSRHPSTPASPPQAAHKYRVNMSTCYMLFVLINIAITVVAQTDSCSEGTYGINCELTCPDQCRPLQTFPCDKRTGQCYEGCNNGYYGDQCDQQCFCPSGICYQETGECYQTGAVTEIITQNTTHRVEAKPGASVHTPVCDGVPAGWRILAALLIVIIIIMIGVVVVVGMLLYRRWGMKQSSHTASGTNQRRFVDNFLHFPCIGGRDRGSDEQSEKEPLETATARPIQEEHDVEAADDQRETQIQTQDRLCDPPVIELRQQQTGDNEELRQRIKELEQEKHKMKDDFKCEMEEEFKQEKLQMEESFNHKKHLMEEKISEQEKILDHLGLPFKSAYHLIKTINLDPLLWLQCPYLEFDKERVNVRVAHIDDNMVLWNTPDARNPVDNSRRFQHFSGTTCTDPLVRTGFFQYFEAIFHFELKRSFGEGEVVMQLGFCGEKDRDVNTFIQGKKECFVLQAVGCKTHKKICLVSIKGDKTDHLINELMDNSEGQEKQVKIGIRLNKEMKRIGVYDYMAFKVLKKTDINIGEKIWPMFGFCAEDEATVKVTLQAGRDIIMLESKKEMVKPKD